MSQLGAAGVLIAIPQLSQADEVRLSRDRTTRKEEEWIRETGLDLVRGERDVYNDSHLVVMDSGTALYYMAQ